MCAINPGSGVFCNVFLYPHPPLSFARCLHAQLLMEDFASSLQYGSCLRRIPVQWLSKQSEVVQPFDQTFCEAVIIHHV